MKKFVAVFFGLVLALSLSACGSKVYEGQVINKQNTPASSYVTMQCASYNSQGVCTVNMPITHHIPEKWSIEIMGTNTDGEKDTTVYRISRDLYEQIDYGDQVKFDENGYYVNHS